MTTVVAAVIEQKGQILICRRRPTDPHPLKWEFPGGKVEPGETPQAALARELKEELNLQVNSAREITSYDFQYPGGNPIHLIFFQVTQSTGDPKNRIFHEIRWEPPATLPDFDFLEGDKPFLKTIADLRS